ncbi:PREDICTED: probable LRR receptor-like serine/threonine-protein kinase RFK1 isoform X2 [Ipomoea nil]|uniref:probable LRR receptor-like serine/threonine-protein kinase RFK1 isoform X2 n=1 Tax=Ipomoea nil TaxID=35883 RepID=UPI0009013C66|nr:PREDICTED: probable LRR receptor-like serine/threonine-protein kinase RFK1 isoform X2 [Ipomoea nil]
MIPGRNAVRSRILALCCFLVLMRFAESRVARREVDVLQQVVTTMGVTSWKFNARSCKIEGVGTAQPRPSWSESDVKCDCNVGNSTVCRHIVGIVLKGLSLPGVLPHKLVGLPYLQHIDFAYNYLSGTIPTEWASTKLNNISVLVNRLSGEIPKVLGNITSLTYLNLEGNQFSGGIPSELGNLVNLKTLMLSSNSLVGRLPASFSALVNLTDLINDNNFTGPIPDFIGNWKQLTRLEMQASGLEGPIPANISLLNNLINLRISDINGPSQGFPPLSSNGGLVTLILRNCNISGIIPPYIWNLKILETLDVSFNKLEGGFPDHISPRSTLHFLFLTGNVLTGHIPSSILVTGLNVDLSYNNFTWQGLDEPACQPNLNLNINMYKSFSTVSALRRVLPCAKEVITCPRYRCSLNVNCGGNDVTANERNREVMYEGDASVEGSSASKYFTSNNYWGFSSTGDFMDDANTQNARFIVSQPSANLSELYRSARISPLSLTYFQYCLENGTYNVSLHFAEIEFRNDSTYYSLGRRIFDIYIQEKLVRKDFNIEEEARGAQRPVVLYFNASVTDNTLEIRVYWAGKGTTRIPLPGHYGPLVSAISVRPYIKCSNGANNHANIYIIVGVVAACSTILMFSLLWWNGCLQCREIHEEPAEGELQMVTYTLRQIRVATRNFDIANKVGEGGFGPVYKGRLPDGTLIAVKQLSSKSRQGNKEFLNEIGMFSCLQHPNVVKLLGGCVEADQLLLVYEYMENNSLANALYKDNQLVLDWPTRLKICIGIARGLTFLHEESSLKIVHRDVKTTNVLLDRDMNPKISDFGLARLNEDDKTHISTRIAGTIGYMAPEYALWGHLTYKADVYSFGIVLLEIVSGQSNTNYIPVESCVCLLDWACFSLLSGNLEQFTDRKLNSRFNKEEVEGVVKVALLCTSAAPTHRPIMSQALGMLEGSISIPAEIPEASTYTDDLRFKAIKDYRREKTKFSNAATGTNSQISGTDYFEYNPESPSRRNQSEIRVVPENPATFSESP